MRLTAKSLRSVARRFRTHLAPDPPRKIDVSQLRGGKVNLPLTFSTLRLHIRHEFFKPLDKSPFDGRCRALPFTLRA